MWIWICCVPKVVWFELIGNNNQLLYYIMILSWLNTSSRLFLYTALRINELESSILLKINRNLESLRGLCRNQEFIGILTSPASLLKSDTSGIICTGGLIQDDVCVCSHWEYPSLPSWFFICFSYQFNHNDKIDLSIYLFC